MTNAPSIDKLTGLGYQIGESHGFKAKGVPLSFGGDLNIIPDNKLNKVYLGSTTNAGFGTPGTEYHVEWGETSTIKGSQFNIFDVAKNLYNNVMGW